MQAILLNITRKTPILNFFKKDLCFFIGLFAMPKLDYIETVRLSTSWTELDGIIYGRFLQNQYIGGTSFATINFYNQHNIRRLCLKHTPIKIAKKKTPGSTLDERVFI
ncbi:hypothetical protein BpHYR1_034946 [Brachionus plicatilis]|uniref:Uncharacterized protein n=1 Tax=Brachionus plicatilis TaxID=10195 RepID=A0A3M7QZ79_BRAPC|nr:hypothetical protein BpHYR1_034946 [Brachionus plicatilis]